MKRTHYRRPLVVKLDRIDPDKVNGDSLNLTLTYQADYIFYEKDGYIKALKNRCGRNGKISMDEHLQSLDLVNRFNIFPLGKFII